MREKIVTTIEWSIKNVVKPVGALLLILAVSVVIGIYVAGVAKLFNLGWSLVWAA